MERLVIGFTGTRHGMTDEQYEVFENIMRGRLVELHHGVCIGADADAHEITRHVAARGSRIVGHLPEDRKLLSSAACDLYRQALPYLERNKRIVTEARCMIATPAEDSEKLRSGTWATIRYARKEKKPLAIIYPDGAIGYERQSDALLLRR